MRNVIAKSQRKTFGNIGASVLMFVWIKMNENFMEDLIEYMLMGIQLATNKEMNRRFREIDICMKEQGFEDRKFTKGEFARFFNEVLK
ncbi:hypothetical protein H8D36_00965 [archaeon]|nr:hypothetical protein [archaeon]